MEMSIEITEPNQEIMEYPYFARTPAFSIVLCGESGYIYLDSAKRFDYGCGGYKESELAPLKSGTKITFTQP